MKLPTPELNAIVPGYRIPFVPIVEADQKVYSLFHDLKKYHWLLQPVISCQSTQELLRNIKEGILD